MRERNPHVPPGDLLRLADGELGPGETDQARVHLQACWECRARFQELESTVGEFMKLTRELSPVAPADPARALFRARLSELASEAPVARGSAVGKAIPAFAAAFLAIVAILITFGGTVSADGPKPKISLTPGETRPVSLAEVCATPDTDDDSADDGSAREIPVEMKRQVFASYGMDPAQGGAYEVDYLITPELGGAHTVRNLWPQPYSARWNARVKDKLEHRLHQLVCQGKVNLATAQHDIATDWIGAYRKYVSAALPR